MGLAGGYKGSIVPAPLPVEAAFAQGKLRAPMFGLWMDGRSNLEMDGALDDSPQAGELVLGGWNRERLGGDIVW